MFSFIILVQVILSIGKLSQLAQLSENEAAVEEPVMEGLY